MRNTLFIIISIVLIYSACQKEEGCTNPQANNYNAHATIDDGSCIYPPITDLIIHFTQTVNENPLIKNNMMYTNQAGENYNSQTLRYLISDINMHSDNGTSTLVENVHFIDISIDSTLKLNISEVSDQYYTSISFTMGLNPIKNFTDSFLNENFFQSFACLWCGILLRD